MGINNTADCWNQRGKKFINETTHQRRRRQLCNSNEKKEPCVIETTKLIKYTFYSDW